MNTKLVLKWIINSPSPTPWSICRLIALRATIPAIKPALDYYMTNIDSNGDAVMSIPVNNTLDGKKVHKTAFSYRYVILDYTLRWATLGLWQYQKLNMWLFWLLQLIIIPCGVLLLQVFEEDKIKATYGPATAVSLDVEGTVWSFFTISFCVISGVYISFSVLEGFPSWARGLLTTVLFLLHVVYMITLFMCSCKPKQIGAKDKADADLEAEFDELSEHDDLLTPIDANDAKIIHLEVKLAALSQRVDTYIIESVLFGALAFTAFVQIISTGKPDPTEINTFVTSVVAILDGLIHANFINTSRNLVQIDNTMSLLSALLVESLVCAMFFLSVIASRLRCSDVMERVNHYIHLAKAYNEKEEEVHNLSLQSTLENESELSIRLNKLGQKIEREVDRAELLMQETNPIVAYMRTFRGLGIGTFLIILITSALLISNSLAAFFVVLSFLAFLYSGLDRAIRHKHFKSILSSPKTLKRKQALKRRRASP